jgi:knotted carbamoyltransferase YgeW
MNFKEIIDKINSEENELYHKDFLLTWDFSNQDIIKVILVAEVLRHFHKNNLSAKIFDSGVAVSIFKDQSTRTRFSFASAANLLGLSVLDFDESKSQVTHGETVRETATMISFLTKIIGIRDDLYPGVGHEFMLEVAQALDDGFAQGILFERPGIINLQCDLDHPTQSMADLFHLINHFGSIENLRGKKIAMSWAYSPSYGKPLSVPQGIMALMTRFGMNVHLAFPEGYHLNEQITEMAKKNAAISGGSFVINDSMEESFREADIVYPKSWAPRDIIHQRTVLIKSGNSGDLKNLEQLALNKNKQNEHWECNEKLMKLTRQGSALYMHCLPADISGVSCKSGEVQKDVFEKYRSLTYLEASLKPYIIASMILNNRVKNPSEVLFKLFNTRKNINPV